MPVEFGGRGQAEASPSAIPCIPWLCTREGGLDILFTDILLTNILFISNGSAPHHQVAGGIEEFAWEADGQHD